jgi:hypothetical protein
MLRPDAATAGSGRNCFGIRKQIEGRTFRFGDARVRATILRDPRFVRTDENHVRNSACGRLFTVNTFKTHDFVDSLQQRTLKSRQSDSDKFVLGQQTAVVCS